MQVGRDKKGFQLILFTPERVFLARIFSVILENYTCQPGDLHPRGAEVWFPPVMDETHGESPEDRDFSAGELQGYRSANAILCRNWLGQIQGGLAQDPLIFQLPMDESEVFMQVLNDHRIYLAAIHAVTEQDMDVNWHKVADSAKGQALLEIHFLAAIIEGMLQSMPPDE